MNRHNYVKRDGAPDVDLWRCQAQPCGDAGPLKELMSRECAHTTTPAEATANILDAIAGERTSP